MFIRSLISSVNSPDRTLRGVSRPQGSQCDIGAFEYDSTSPFVVSSLHSDPNPTNETIVDFTITFSGPVTGVNISDFNLNTTGISGATVAEVIGSGSVYTVTVITGDGYGTCRLDLVDDDSILDMALLPLGGEGEENGNYNSGEVYIIGRNSLFLPMIIK